MPAASEIRLGLQTRTASNNSAPYSALTYRAMVRKPFWSELKREIRLGLQPHTASNNIAPYNALTYWAMVPKLGRNQKEIRLGLQAHTASNNSAPYSALNYRAMVPKLGRNPKERLGKDYKLTPTRFAPREVVDLLFTAHNKRNKITQKSYTEMSS